MPSLPVDVLWCANQRAGRSNRWSFPPNVSRLLQEKTADRTVLHAFGGLSRFGTRVDIDASTRPHVMADAWMLPFAKNSFDTVILDPPYFNINQQMKQQLLRGAAYVAARRVFWFHTLWVAGDRHCRPVHAWLVRVGDSCNVRCLIEMATDASEKKNPVTFFTRGPQMKYNRWLVQPQGLPFDAPE